MHQLIHRDELASWQYEKPSATSHQKSTSTSNDYRPTYCERWRIYGAPRRQNADIFIAPAAASAPQMKTTPHRPCAWFNHARNPATSAWDAPSQDPKHVDPSVIVVLHSRSLRDICYIWSAVAPTAEPSPRTTSRRATFPVPSIHCHHVAYVDSKGPASCPHSPTNQRSEERRTDPDPVNEEGQQSRLVALHVRQHTDRSQSRSIGAARYCSGIAKASTSTRACGRRSAHRAFTAAVTAFERPEVRRPCSRNQPRSASMFASA